MRAARVKERIDTTEQRSTTQPTNTSLLKFSEGGADAEDIVVSTFSSLGSRADVRGRLARRNRCRSVG